MEPSAPSQKSAAKRNCMQLQSLVSLQIPEKREASDKERPFWDTASRDWPSQPSERQKLTLSTAVTTGKQIQHSSWAVGQTHRQTKRKDPALRQYVEVMQLQSPKIQHIDTVRHRMYTYICPTTHVNCVKAMLLDRTKQKTYPGTRFRVRHIKISARTNKPHQVSFII